MIPILYAAIVLAVMLVWLALVVLVERRMRSARNAPATHGQLPSVSVIVAAMNEAEEIEPAIRSMLALDYPAMELIVVNDRSTDATGPILDRLALEFPNQLRVLHVTELPAGWLGKCNALRVGAKQARGEWILFTDADVVFTPPALRTAAAFALAHSADHVVLIPVLKWHGYAEAALLSFFTMTFSIGFRLWAIETPSKHAFAGVGAFNMIRRSFYERMGGHTPLRLEVADDLKLGYLVKKHGGKSVAAYSDNQVSVRWRAGVRDTIRGLERSGFAGLNFSYIRTLGAALGCIVGLNAPYVLPFIAPSPAVIALSLAAILVIVATYAINARPHHLPRWIGLLHPLATTLFAYAFIRSAIITTIRGGLSWRGTFYLIQDLRRGTVR